MKYEHITEGRFIDRPNRFIAHVEINGQVETVHVKNTGRCRELLVPGTQVFLEKSSNPASRSVAAIRLQPHARLLTTGPGNKKGGNPKGHRPQITPQTGISSNRRNRCT